MKLNVGMVGGYSWEFQGAKFGILDKSISNIKSLAKEKQFNFIPIEYPIIDKADAIKARKELDEKDIDFLLIQCSSFTDAEILIPLLKGDEHLGIWAVEEPTKEGPLPLNSFCGLNMFASIIAHYLKEHRIPCKWFYGFDIESELFKRRFNITIRVLTAIKKLRQSRIGFIGGLAPGFTDFYFDERTIQKRFGCWVETPWDIEISDIGKIAQQCDSVKVRKLAKEMKSEASACKVSDDMIEKNARVYLALEQIVEEKGYNALGISCWPKFQQDHQCYMCSAIARLNEKGIAVACEGDVPSAISMMILNYLGGGPSMLTDLTDFDDKDQSILLWHCGPAPQSFANEKGTTLDYYFTEFEVKGQKIRAGVVNDMVFKPQHLTIMRMTREGEQFLLLDGDIVNGGKKVFNGSAGWLGNVRLNTESISVKDLVNTIVVQGFQHHYPITSGDLTDEVMELGAWLDMRPLEKVGYKDYLQLPR